MTSKNKAYYQDLGRKAAATGDTCKFKGGWQRKAWQEGFDSCNLSAKARAAVAAKMAKMRMAASHPDHGGTCEAFRKAHSEWKAAERYAASL